MRVIIRFSLNRDSGSKLRNALLGNLYSAGIVWTGTKTGTYEGVVTVSDVRDAMQKFWDTVHNYMGPAHVDHFWMYCDQTPSSGGGDNEADHNSDDD